MDASRSVSLSHSSALRHCLTASLSHRLRASALSSSFPFAVARKDEGGSGITNIKVYPFQSLP